MYILQVFTLSTCFARAFLLDAERIIKRLQSFSQGYRAPGNLLFKYADDTYVLIPALSLIHISSPRD